MKTPLLRKCFLGILVAMLLTGLGGYALSAGGGVTQTYKSANQPLDSAKQVASDLTLPLKTVMVMEPYQGGAFWVETRKDKMERFRCSRCHDNKPVFSEKAKEVAHGEIKLVHGSKSKPLNCYTCHHKEERDSLETEKGEKVDMDHSYQLCGQCHFRQKKDWVGGAHGKRIKYWAGQRVVMACTSCHDPHSPRFAQRWPKTYSSPTAK